MYGSKKEKRPLKDGELDELLSRKLSMSELRRLAEAELCTFAKHPDDVPQGAVFHVLVVETVTPLTGWENEGGGGKSAPFWKLFCFTEENLVVFLALAQAYFEQRTKAAGDQYAVPDEMVFLNRGKKLVPKLTVQVI